MAAPTPTTTANNNGHAATTKDSTLPDPTRVFSLLVLAIMTLRYLDANDWKLSSIVEGFYLHPVVLTALGLSLVVVYKGYTGPVSNTDRMAAEWYWWNAWLYHTVMDGASGTFHLVPMVVHQYFVLDKRFITHHVGPWLIGFIELFVMQPMCWFTLWTILKRSPWRWPMEMLTSAFQLFGMLVFVGAELYEGQLNVPAEDPVGIDGNRWANVRFNLYHLTYYWFGFWFCNLVWGVVPIYRIYRAAEECRAALEWQSHTKKGKQV